MRYDILRKYGHYELYVNGRFYGSYDTWNEAAKEVDELRNGTEVVA